jgi:hypothetical protein
MNRLQRIEATLREHGALGDARLVRDLAAALRPYAESLRKELETASDESIFDTSNVVGERRRARRVYEKLLRKVS